MEKVTLNDIRIILEKAQVPYGCNAVTSWGSEYLTVFGTTYRKADHRKPCGEYGYIDIKSWGEVLISLKENFDLTDKTEAEKRFKDALVIEPSNKYDGCVMVNGNHYRDEDSARRCEWEKNK